MPVGAEGYLSVAKISFSANRQKMGKEMKAIINHFILGFIFPNFRFSKMIGAVKNQNLRLEIFLKNTTGWLTYSVKIMGFPFFGLSGELRC